MLGDSEPDNNGDGRSTNHQLSIVKACEEYNSSVKLTLDCVNRQLDDVLLKNCNALDELAIKIAARMNFLERNPSFLSCLVYDQNCVQCEPLLEFDDVRITLKEHSRRIYEKVDEIQKYHRKVLDLVIASGRNQAMIGEGPRNTTTQKEEPEEEFQDCIDKPKEETPEPNDSHEETPTKKTSFDRVTIQRDAYSDNSLDNEPVVCPVKFQLFPDIVPDVYRRKPNEDLHAKLCQLITNDSLENFLQFMDPKKSKSKTKPKKATPLEQKYTGSLWFFPKENKQPSSGKSGSRKANKKRSSTASTVSTSVTLSVSSCLPSSLTNQDKSDKMKQGLSRNKLQYYDILDDVDQNDVQPIKSEYPRRDNVNPKPLKPTKSYLHRMMHENDKVWKKLLQPAEKKKKKHRTETKKSQVLPPETQHIKSLMQFLTSPEQKILGNVPNSLIVMPVAVCYDNFPTKDDHAVREPTKALEPMKVEGRFLQTSPRACEKSPTFPIQKRKEMLQQLRGLKSKNDNIQKNIQKAIDVIETKMVDLLSSPSDADSSDAFNAMEKEITTVLKMMTESQQTQENVKGDQKLEDGEVKTPRVEKSKNVEEGKIDIGEDQKKKSPAEKDVKVTSRPGSPKLKRGLTVVKKAANAMRWEGGDCGGEGVKNKSDDGVKPKKEDVEKNAKKVTRDHKVEKAMENKVTRDNRPERATRSRDPSVERHKIKSPKSGDNWKKIANIEEGERLLGQVDSVIKKIDSIYNRFYDDSKGKGPTKPEANFSNIVDFFDGIKGQEETVVLVGCQLFESVPKTYSLATVRHQKRQFHLPTIEQLPSARPHEPQLPRPHEPQLPRPRETQTPIVTAPHDEDKRHAHTLRAFYAFFFSTVFATLSFDFAA